ncbi:MAG: DnaB-like helicase C-terminal domain-containing protein, partial [Alphaproteobacteria bacterium]
MNENELRKTLDVFRTDNGLRELRVINMLNGGENYSAIFDNDDDLIREVQQFDKEPYNIYFIFNELKDATKGMVQLNHFVRRASTIKDTNIKYLRWLMVDLDPIREGGVKDISSNEEEFENAHKRMIEVYRYLKSCGLSEPVICKSGNGYHAMYRLSNVEPTKENTDYIKDFFNYMSLMFTDDKVDFDTKNSNAARLTKFYSSTARKGANIPDRPHRESKIIKCPDAITPIDFNIIIVFANKYRSIQSENPNENIDIHNKRNYNSEKKFDIDDFLRSNNIEVLRETRQGTSRKIILKECPFNPEHGKDSAIFVSESGAISFTCFHAGCSNNNWQKLRLKYDPHCYDKKEYDKLDYQPRYRGNVPPKKKYEIKDENDELGKKWYSLSDIKKIDLSELEHIKTGYTILDNSIQGLYLGEVTILSGSNSSGKSSWLNNLILNVINQGYKTALWSGELPPAILKNWIQMCAAGKEFLRQSRRTNKYYVPNDIATKIDQWTDGKFFLYNNDYSNKWEQIFHDMKELIKLGVKLFCLDNMFSLDIDLFDGDKNNKQKELVLQICDFVKENQVHIILVAHPRKVTSFLRKTDISGTADITNAADNVFICHRVNNDFIKAGGEFFGQGKIQEYTSFGNVIEVAKNRLWGAVDILCGMHYEIESRR